MRGLAIAMLSRRCSSWRLWLRIQADFGYRFGVAGFSGGIGGDRAGVSRVPIFSVDMQGGQLLTRIEEWKLLSPMEVVGRVMDAGMRRLIVLDLADVGVGGEERGRGSCARRFAGNIRAWN